MQKEELLLKGIAPILRNLLSNGTKDLLCQEIISIFSDIKFTDAEPQIIELLNNRPNPDLQVVCIKALGEFKTKQASIALQKIIKNPGSWHKDVVSQTIIATRKMNPRDYLNILVKLLLDNDVANDTKREQIIPAIDALDTDRSKSIVIKYGKLIDEGVSHEQAFSRLSEENK